MPAGLASWVEAVGHGDDLQQRGAAGQGIDPGLLHGAFHGHPLAHVFGDEYGDLGILHVVRLQAPLDLVLQLGDGQPLRLHAPGQRQGNFARLGDPYAAGQLFHAEDLDVQHVQRTHAIVQRADHRRRRQGAGDVHRRYRRSLLRGLLVDARAAAAACECDGHDETGDQQRPAEGGTLHGSLLSHAATDFSSETTQFWYSCNARR